MVKWIQGDGDCEDVVVSTRIRFARNLEGYKFPRSINLSESQEITDKILTATKDISHNSEYNFYPIANTKSIDRLALVEDHLISPNLIKEREKSSLILKNDEKISIMINEEDHLRLQVLMPGLNFHKAWEICNKLDDELESSLNYAFDEKFGYLTACPTNVGTGLRASVMVHLPAFFITGNIRSLVEGISKIGLTVRGIYGEGSEALGELYQISNQITLGEDENKIISKLQNVINQIISKERKLRLNLLNNKRGFLEDRVFRSLGLLKNARIMSSREGMRHLSNIRLGVSLDLIDEKNLKDISELMIKIQPANIEKQGGQISSKEDRDIERANYIRNIFNKE